jgi:phosphate starvation-inducible PhoH-like protein
LDLTITVEEPGQRMALFGSGDRNLRTIREAFGVRIAARDSSLKFSGNAAAVAKAAKVVERLQETLRHNGHLSEQQVAAAIHEVSREAEKTVISEQIEVYTKGSVIVPKTDGQRHYVQAIRQDDLVFCLGPAGTGKTYLAVALGVSLLKAGVIKRIVLVRPAVEAGEKLGYLPGDMQAKVNPYLRPLFDAMHDMMTFEQLRRFMQNDVIEVIPLAFMRGRTLNSAAVILDEAQNTTISQMLMFLTRLGHYSKMIVTGDDSQIDLPEDQPSGLIDAVSRLKGLSGIAVVRLGRLDIVRHRLVQEVVNAYGGMEMRRRNRAQSERRAAIRSPQPPGQSEA